MSKPVLHGSRNTLTESLGVFFFLEYISPHVRDRGPGMRPEVAAKVFDRLYSRSKGVGVGLGIARAIVDQHGGHIDVRSDPGSGSTFTIRLPAFAATS